MNANACDRRILNVVEAARYLRVSKSWLNKARVSGMVDGGHAH